MSRKAPYHPKKETSTHKAAEEGRKPDQYTKGEIMALVAKLLENDHSREENDLYGSWKKRETQGRKDLPEKENVSPGKTK